MLGRVRYIVGIYYMRFWVRGYIEEGYRGLGFSDFEFLVFIVSIRLCVRFVRF